MMKRIALILLTLWNAGSARADDSAWLTSFPEAAEQAKAENKLLLLDFTGSDWCHWCMQLEQDTFSRPEFLDYAAQNLVLLRVDFPMHKTLPDELKDANRALKKKYDVEGFPSIVILKPNGKVLWTQPGYAPGGPRVMIDAANQCRRAAGLGAPVGQPVPAAPPVAAAPARPAPVAVAPVAPAPPPRKPGDQPKLQGFVYSTKHATAVLDGQVCLVGETVHGMKVLKIARDGVIVEWQGKTNQLTPR